MALVAESTFGGRTCLSGSTGLSVPNLYQQRGRGIILLRGQSPSFKSVSTVVQHRTACIGGVADQ